MPPIQKEIEEIRIALDDLSDLKRNFTIQSLLSVITELLDAVPQPLVHWKEFDEFISENLDIEGKNLKEILGLKLNAVRRKCLFYLLNFIKWIYNKKNQLFDDIIEEFLYPLFHLKRISRDEKQHSRRKLYLKLLITEE